MNATELPKIEDSSYNGEFDPGSERTLAARLTHASLTRNPVAIQGGKVANG